MSRRQADREQWLGGMDDLSEDVGVERKGTDGVEHGWRTERMRKGTTRKLETQSSGHCEGFAIDRARVNLKRVNLRGSLKL